MGFVGGEKGVMAVETCKSRVIQPVTAILRRERLCLLGTVRGHQAEAVRNLGKADGMGGQDRLRSKRFPF